MKADEEEAEDSDLQLKVPTWARWLFPYLDPDLFNLVGLFPFYSTGLRCHLFRHLLFSLRPRHSALVFFPNQRATVKHTLRSVCVCVREAVSGNCRKSGMCHCHLNPRTLSVRCVFPCVCYFLIPCCRFLQGEATLSPRTSGRDGKRPHTLLTDYTGGLTIKLPCYSHCFECVCTCIAIIVRTR